MDVEFNDKYAFSSFQKTEHTTEAMTIVSVIDIVRKLAFP